MLKFLFDLRVVRLGIDALLLPLLTLSAPFFLIYRRIGSMRLPLSTKILKKIGVFPIVNHFYEPCFNHAENSKAINLPRQLPGINFNELEQLELLKKLNFGADFELFLSNQLALETRISFKLENGNFQSGDAEFLFNMVRYLKPKKIIEIGCGESTKIIAAALKINEKENQFRARHICIEPYKQPWLDTFHSIELIRFKVEDLDIEIFKSLKAGDLLFIDSSHVIRPNGDVLFEYLQVIPQLQSGVICHVHDIFSPRDYPDEWLQEKVLFWNEQYLLEALLTDTTKYQVVAALNFLKNEHYEELLKVAPHLEPNREPGSFYFKII